MIIKASAGNSDSQVGGEKQTREDRVGLSKEVGGQQQPAWPPS